ncbi:DUF4236 domain-containing protein [Bacillus thuringiensis]|uniref:DUF4236 domain-containing protein n=1 Tax=Bacillus thuringiensis TaxID=1428 RepID=UPI0021E81E60|nr:DUF4236 domain-containing protein [Bacillus thuringiensis]
MCYKFRTSIKVAPGVRVNVNKNGVVGVSTEMKGVPGAKINVTKKSVGVSTNVKGVRVSTGPSGTKAYVPGTGVSFEQRKNNKKKSSSQTQKNTPNQDNSSKIFEANAIRIKDNKTNSITKKMMLPLAVLTGIISVASLVFSVFNLAFLCGVISFFCYKDSKIPIGVICPSCKKQQSLLSKKKEIQCVKCKSILSIRY